MNVKNNTKKFHDERITKVIKYINNHLDKELDLNELARVGNYSTYHFHRIMRAYLTESLGAYIVRVRLETAAGLLQFSSMQVADIALKVGYGNTSSFNKAFKKRFGISPNEYRQDRSLSKAESTRIKIYAMENLKSLEPKIKEIKAKNLIYAQALGNYNKSAGEAWEKVCDFAKKKRLFGFKTEFIGISHDDPNVTDADKLRYDACLVVSKDVEPEGEIGIQQIKEGKYAIFTHKGPYDKLNDSYGYIYGKWMMDNNIQLRDTCGFEKYLNSPDKTKPEKLRTEIYVPIL